MIGTRNFLLLATASALLLSPVAGRDALAQTGQRAQERPGAMVAYTTEAVATVESINQQSREVLLRGAGGRLFSVKAGPAVENLSRVKAGDRVVVRYVEALAASLAKPGQAGGSGVTEQGGIARHAPEGARPTGTVGNQIRTTVTIDAIDRAPTRSPSPARAMPLARWRSVIRRRSALSKR